MSEHDFRDVDLRILPNPEVRLAMARAVSGMEDVIAEANFAATLDEEIGGSDLFAGARYGYLLARSSDDREVVERVIMAADMLRQATRTRH